MNGEFDIYQTKTGVTAVTNPVQRQIMAALREGDKQLPELVDITGKAKPTLSSIHVKELLNRELIAELPHPTDSRRKIYQCTATPVGSSNLPIESLRTAVKQYAATNANPGISLRDALVAIAAGGDEASTVVLKRQAEAVGAACRGKWADPTLPQLIQSFSQSIQTEQLGTPMSADFVSQTYKFQSDALETTGTLAALLLEGLFNGAMKAAGKPFACTSEGRKEWYTLSFSEV